MTTKSNIPLVVDLDGTLIKTDCLIESLIALVKQYPVYIFIFPFWLLYGKAYLKWKIAEKVDLDIKKLPYNSEFISYLEDQKLQGRQLVLATASYYKYAEDVAKNLQLFDSVFATNEKMNLSGQTKRSVLVEQFGEKGFDYAGNSLRDLKVWNSANAAILVNTSKGVERRVREIATINRVFSNQRGKVISYLRALRIHQWLKNLLIFVPLLTAHKITDFQYLFHSLLAFLSFSLCASGVYLLNDLLDLQDDRHHNSKRNRPLASGDMPLAHGLTIIPFLILAAFGIALLLPYSFLIVLSSYYALTVTYSLWLKCIALLDVLVLASLYTIRIIAGLLAASIEYSFWLLAFSVFLFLSLAIVKRYTELAGLKNGLRPKGRDYQVQDRELLAALGGASGYLSVLILALYINSPEVLKLYSNPKLLWLLCPIMLYWISRVWFIAHRGNMHDDPIIFAIRDKVSLMIAGIMVTVVILAS